MNTNSSLSNLKPWSVRPFELLFHAEMHIQNGTDYDRRLSLISFDNAIEVSITTYLSLNPIQRENRSYPRKDVDKWLKNYHTKLDFFFSELHRRGLPTHKEKKDIVWYHDQRSEQYHGSNSGVPSMDTLNNIRQIAIWIFSVLFQMSNVETILKSALTISERSYPEIPKEIISPRIEGVKKIHETSLFIASILGGWNENSQEDDEIIDEVTSGF